MSHNDTFNTIIAKNPTLVLNETGKLVIAFTYILKRLLHDIAVVPAAPQLMNPMPTNARINEGFLTPANANPQIPDSHTVGSRNYLKSSVCRDIANGWREIVDWFIQCYGLVKLSNATDEKMTRYFERAGFAANASPWQAVRPIFEYAAIKLPLQLSPDQVRSLSNVNDFLKYALTPTSTPSICKRVMSNLGDNEALLVFGQAQIDDINNACRDPTNKTLHDNINMRSKVVAWAYLSANDSRIANWKQGEKAWNEASESLKNNLVAYFRTRRTANVVFDDTTTDAQKRASGVYV